MALLFRISPEPAEHKGDENRSGEDRRDAELILDLRGAALAQAEMDKCPLFVAQIISAMSQPFFRIAQGFAAQQNLLARRRGCRARHHGAQAFLPRPKFAVGIHPFAQSRPRRD